MKTDLATIERFGERCPYTDKKCKKWECDKCPVEEQERKWMEELDNDKAGDD